MARWITTACWNCREGKTPEELRDFLLETLRGGGLNTEPLGQTIDQYMDENAIRASHIKYGLVITEIEHPAQRAVYAG